MPDLDFSDVLNSREFEDNFQLTRTVRQVDVNGVSSVLSAKTTAAVGIVVPGKGNLRRMDDGSRVTAYIEIYTKVGLSTGVHTSDNTFQDADVVTWAGNKYTVVATEDYSRFGTGFTKASCDLLPFNATA